MVVFQLFLPFPCFQDFIRSGIEGIILDANHSNPALEIEKELQAILQLSMGEYKRFSTAAWTKAKEYSVSKVAENTSRISDHCCKKRISV